MEYILNKGNDKKEKLLIWNSLSGFDDEHSDEESTKYKREIRK